MINKFPYMKPYLRKKLKNWLEKQKHNSLSDYHKYKACSNEGAAMQCSASASTYNSISESYIDYHMEKPPRKEYRVVMSFEGYEQRYAFGSIEELTAFKDCYNHILQVFEGEGLDERSSMMRLFESEDLDNPEIDDLYHKQVTWLKEGK